MINVAELLKDAPEGTELWFTLYGKVKFMSVNFHETYPIQVRLDDTTVEKLDKYGRYYDHFEDGECVLFPRKDCRTWEGWKPPIESKFKVGDWITDGICKVKITNINNNYYWFSKSCILGEIETIDKNYHLWSIEDAKDGDVLAADECYVIFKEIDGLNIKCYCTYHYMGFHPSFHIDTLQNKTAFKPATREQRILFFKKMQEADYRWDEKNKVLHKIKHYDIANFKPKQWVLVRDDDEWEWALTRFSHLSNGSASSFVCINGASFQQCIPFEKNEKLLGTTNICPEEFINW